LSRKLQLTCNIVFAGKNLRCGILMRLFITILEQYILHVRVSYFYVYLYVYTYSCEKLFENCCNIPFLLFSYYLIILFLQKIGNRDTLLRHGGNRARSSNGNSYGRCVWRDTPFSETAVYREWKVKVIASSVMNVSKDKPNLGGIRFLCLRFAAVSYIWIRANYQHENCLPMWVIFLILLSNILTKVLCPRSENVSRSKKYVTN